MTSLSHINPDNQPEMVDVGSKSITRRVAHARAVVLLNEEIMKQLIGSELMSKKGPVFQTANIAGIMAAKKTHELIPLCHPLVIEDCKIQILPADDYRVVIDCTTKATHKTGVEMEALTGAAVAALTIYDMCKSVSKEIVIESVRLIKKTGGKSDFEAV